MTTGPEQQPLPFPVSGTNSYPPPVAAPPAVPYTPPTDWFPVSMSGWRPPVRDGWYDWRRIGTQEYDRLWWSVSSNRVFAVAGHCPPLVWDAWRGINKEH